MLYNLTMKGNKVLQNLDMRNEILLFPEMFILIIVSTFINDISLLEYKAKQSFSAPIQIKVTPEKEVKNVNR